jgi:hypothetical protein
MRGLGLSLAIAFVALGCKEPNPDYCADASAYRKSCSEYDAALHDMKAEKIDGGDAADATDVADATEAGDTLKDAVEAPAEKKPFCTVDGGECAAMADGGLLLACDTSGAQPKCVECVDSTSCKDTKKPVCDTTAHRCVECVGTGTECKFDAARTACDMAAQKCVECVDDSKCGGTKPVCDKNQKACRACAADAECKTAPGICVDYDGHCALAAEVVTLQGGAACVPAGALFCKASLASAAISSTTPILLVQGPDPVGAIEPTAGAATRVLIVGKGNATVGAGTGDTAGIHLQGATEYWVRDLTVSGGTLGLWVDGAKVAHINRCTVTNNGQGGIKTTTAGFDITNTIIANNMARTDAGGVVWAGARLGDVPTGAPSRFANNTVVGNKQIGVSCQTPYDTSTNIIHGNNGDIGSCSGAPCCGATDPDPKLDAAYHLTTGSPCIDKLDPPAMSVGADIQGQARPNGPKLDCGADEYVP